MIPYGKQTIDESDREAVLEVLRSNWLTQGPRVDEFEKNIAAYCSTKYAVVMSNGTAALEAAYYAIGLQPGDEFITSPITFPATSNAALWFGGKPIFVDVDAATGNIDTNLIEAKITSRTKAIVPIHYTGRPVDLKKIKEIAAKYNLVVIEDACQALGAVYQGKKIGCDADMAVFSFHPVKTITTGEGGAVVTNNLEYYKKMKRFISHGMEKENFIKESPGEWYLEIQDMGHNYRLTDIQSALGSSQLKKVDAFVDARKKIVERYRQAFASCPELEMPPADTNDVQSAWHLFVIRIAGKLLGKQKEFFSALRARGIGVQVHHIPVHLQPYYERLGYRAGLCPTAEKYYERIMSLPLYPNLSEEEQNTVIKVVFETINSF